MFSGIRGGSAGHFYRYAPWVFPILRAFSPQVRKDTSANYEHASFCHEKAKERMALGEEPAGRRDFMTYMMRENREGERPITMEEIMSNVPILVAAGSETTATSLSGLTFYLSQYPAVYKKVAEEVRSAFTSESEINFHSAARLKYLAACLEEILRMFPAAAEIPPRRSPGATVAGYCLPKDVSTKASSFCSRVRHAPSNSS